MKAFRQINDFKNWLFGSKSASIPEKSTGVGKINKMDDGSESYIEPPIAEAVFDDLTNQENEKSRKFKDMSNSYDDDNEDGWVMVKNRNIREDTYDDDIMNEWIIISGRDFDENYPPRKHDDPLFSSENCMYTSHGQWVVTPPSCFTGSPEKKKDHKRQCKDQKKHSGQIQAIETYNKGHDSARDELKSSLNDSTLKSYDCQSSFIGNMLIEHPCSSFYAQFSETLMHLHASYIKRIENGDYKENVPPIKTTKSQEISLPQGKFKKFELSTIRSTTSTRVDKSERELKIEDWIK